MSGMGSYASGSRSTFTHPGRDAQPFLIVHAEDDFAIFGHDVGQRNRKPIGGDRASMAFKHIRP